MTTAVPSQPETSPKSERSHYMIELDGLRAIAALAVLVPHVTPGLSYGLPMGALAVKLFFVLSGFLITGILLKCRDQIDAGDRVSRVALQFYARRSLRIFPIYYLTVIVCALLGVKFFGGEMLKWHLLYLTNWYIPFVQQGWIENASHLWTLAVEEQFYLLWPALVLLMPRKLFLPVAMLAIPAAVAWRLAAKVLKWDHLAQDTPLFAAMDSLFMGALLAMMWRWKETSWRKPVDRAAKWFGLPLLLAICVLGVVQYNFVDPMTKVYAVSKATETWVYRLLNVRWIIGDVIFGLVFIWIIDRAARRETGIFSPLLSSRVMTYLGKISYGLYLYHNVLSLLVKHLLIKSGFTNTPSVIVLLLNVIVTVGVASLSWFIIEKPINSLKRFFEYARNPKPVQA